MPPVPCAAKRRVLEAAFSGWGQRPIAGHGQAANGEGEDKAFDIEAGPMGQIEQAGRVPVFGHEQGFCQTEGCGQHAGPKHATAQRRPGDEQQCPGHQKGRRPDQPSVLVAGIN